MRRTTAVLLAVLLVGTVAAANYATSRYGLVPAGFGLLVTAGTYFAGISFGLRDAVQKVGGVAWASAAIAGGILLSVLLGTGRIALASAVAFGVSESTDLAVYTPLRRRNWRVAVAASNAVGALADTLLFLYLAGFPVTGRTVGGQMLVKAVWMTLAALLVGEVLSRAVSRHRLQPSHT